MEKGMSLADVEVHGRSLDVYRSKPPKGEPDKKTLFVSALPTTITRQEILDEFTKASVRLLF
jgi:RNA recognition motif-containing protein